MEMMMNQDSPMMAMNMKMTAKQNLIAVKDGNYLTEMKFSKIAMDMMQAGMQMSASTEDKDEDLDEIGKQVKAQLTQMLGVTIAAETNNKGKIINTKVEPSIPGTEQIANQTGSVIYPDKAIRVGDTWTDEKNEQGVITNTTYKVVSIGKDKVLLDVSGNVSGTATGTVSGNIEIDKKSGVPTLSKTIVKMETNGQKVSVGVTIKMNKL